MAYNFYSVLKFGDRQIISEEDAQQGDPLGLLMFCFTIHYVLKSLNTIFIIGYMDDVTLGGPHDIVADDINSVIAEWTNIGFVS